MASRDHICGAETTTTSEVCQNTVASPDSRCPHHDDGESPDVGRPQHEPTEATRAVVEALAMGGHDQETISDRVGICVETLTLHYPEILERAEVSANSQVVQTAFKMATSGQNPSMTKYWLNCRSEDWESKKKVDHSSSDGSMSPKEAKVDVTALSDDALDEIIDAQSDDDDA